MNKILVVYYSVHHGNTKKIIDYLAENCEIDTLNIANNRKEIDEVNSNNIHIEDKLGSYEKIILGSGIYYGKISKEIYSWLDKNIDTIKNKSIYAIITSGLVTVNYGGDLEKYLDNNGMELKSKFHCKGFDTYGPWKLIGGISKGHPDENDLKNALKFVKKEVF
ncbi:flavodoxin domain-containing protein [Peptostreptococcus canis]|uniref:Flavodoxin n=1 Tax=Peptostreptococcus canis TaxID=1159213 RepID=A0ABR6TIR2_9FIRM|nr:flavodoxin domain-containing protein [Peptostreptococcus canis]MBC2575310.1 flavodoxin [Peptostreptococcus canis]MBP1997507.1 flavodoxin [Peptostreptococcus canis]